MKNCSGFWKILTNSCDKTCFNLEHEQPHKFSQCQWQKSADTTAWYISYRVLHLVACYFMLIVSLGNFGREAKPLYYFLKYPIYLTHWGVIICDFQSTLGLALVCHRMHLDRLQKNDAIQRGSGSLPKMNHLIKAYWITNSIAVVTAIVITMLYWILVYEPEEEIDYITATVHIFNTIIMLIDLCLVAHPVQFQHVVWTILFSVAYLAFNYIYFLSGGKGRNDEPWIYAALDWNYPLKSLTYCGLALVAFVLTHGAISLLSWLRAKIFTHDERPREPIETIDV